MITLRVTGSGRSIEIERRTLVGRADCDLTIADPELSRHHMAVRPADGGVEVEDLGSMNGTFVDGERLTGSMLLDQSARLSIGGTELELDIPEPRQAAPPPTRISRRPAPAVAGAPAEAGEPGAAKAALIMGLTAGALGVIASVAHPQPDPNDLNVKAFLDTIVPSGTWVLLHVLILFSLILGCAALVLFHYTMLGGRAAVLARSAAVALVVATAVGVVWMLLDGVAMKAIADDWADSAGAAHVADERAAIAIEHLILALFSAWLLLWQGLAYLLFGLAILREGRFATWLGAMGVAIGAASFALGLVQFETERDALVTHILVPIVSVFGGLWIPIVVVSWWRRVRSA